MKTALIHHPVYGEHDPGPNHPESLERYAVIMKVINEDAALTSFS
ncbi:MAG: hypothetical protein WKF30_07630 [Pyrinomonadaceae bacterium]